MNIQATAQNPQTNKTDIKSKLNQSIQRQRHSLQKPIQSINRNQLNSSLSKMQYTFSKSDRFNNSTNNQMVSDKFYELPPVLRTQRSSSFGYGNKIQFGKNGKFTPAPGHYEVMRDFEGKLNKGSSMALSRQEIKFNDLFRSRANTFKAQPASYNVSLSIKSPKYSIGERFKQIKSWIQMVPGPGNYKHEQPTGNLTSTVSNYRTSPGTKFPKTQRLKQILSTNLTTPGPGSYATNMTTIKKYGTVIGTSTRQQKLSSQKFVSPGPGTYKMFSQFLH